ncbi:MAG: OmpP1/FadL family transporter [Gammaproteobacteria bacterium]
MKFFNKTFLATAVVTSLVLPTAAFATNGMNPEGNGVKARGMGGAGVALANETASTVTNPAAVVGVGHRLDVSVGVFSPNPRSYTLTGNGFGFDASQESESNLFVIPFFGMAFPINEKSAWGFSLNAAGGMNTEYNTNFGAALGNTTKTGINLEQLFVSGTYGHKVGANTTLGVSAIYAYQKFEATGLEAFQGASRFGNNLSNVGSDTSDGFGVKIGIQGDISKEVKYGVSYQPKIGMSKFDKYKGLFADQGQLDIPATFNAGIAWSINPKTILAFDYANIDYEGVNAIGNSVNNYVPGVVEFGDSGGPGFGWKSINIFKLGVAYESSKDWIWRAGWNHGENPVTSEEISVAFLAPAVIEDHLTLGFTGVINPKSEWSMNFVHSFKNSTSGTFNPNFGGGTMTVEMEQNFLELGYSRLF